MSSLLKSGLSFLSKFVPVGLAIEGLEKTNPQIKSFLSGALAAGYTANEALDFLRQQVSSDQPEQDPDTLRPDEKAGLARKKQEEAPSKALQAAGTLAAAGLGGVGASALTRAAATAAPEAAKTVTEQSNTTEKAAQSGSGLNAQAIRKQAEQMQPSQAQQTAQQTAQTAAKAVPETAFDVLLDQEPELANAIDAATNKGMSIDEAVAAVKANKKLMNAVNRVESKTGQDLASVLKQILGVSSRATQASSGGDDKLTQALIGLANVLK